MPCLSPTPCPQVTITVLDENDNSPQFDITSDSSVSVAEDCAVGKRVALVLARDPDAGSNGQVGRLGAAAAHQAVVVLHQDRSTSVSLFPTPSPPLHPARASGGC